MIIKYVCSNGKEYNLFDAKMKVTSGTFHAYEWKKVASELEMGEDVFGFTKESKEYDMTFTVRGDIDERRQMLNELQDAFEYDIANVKPGRIWYGEYYIDCYIVSLKNKKSGTWNNWSDCETKIYCPYTLWSKEEKRSFWKDSMDKGEEYEFLDYPYKYKYDYSRGKSGSQNWEINHFRKSNFKMIIFGPAANPRIVINGHIYQINDTLEESEYIEIDSRRKTVTKYLSNGTKQNIFAKRRKDQSVFELIPSDNLLITWSGEFGFDLIVYKERSTPEYGPDTN